MREKTRLEDCLYVYTVYIKKSCQISLLLSQYLVWFFPPSDEACPDLP